MRNYFLLSALLLPVLAGCEENWITGTVKPEADLVCKNMTIEVSARNPEGTSWRLPSLIQYYSSVNDSLRTASVVDRNGHYTTTLELAASDGDITIIASAREVIGHSSSEILLADVVCPRQSGDFGTESLFLSRTSSSSDIVTLENTLGLLKVEVKDPSTRELILHTPDHAVLHHNGTALYDIRSHSFKDMEENGSEISFTVDAPGIYYFALFPGLYERGVVIDCLDASNALRYSFSGNTGMIQAGDVKELGVVDIEEKDRYEENAALSITGLPEKIWYRTPFSPSVYFNGKAYRATFESPDGAFGIEDMTLKADRTGRHIIKATVQAEEHLWYFREFTLDVYDAADFYMMIRPKDDTNSTYGNSQVVLYYSGLQNVTIEFGVKGTAKPLIGSAKTQWLYETRKITMAPGQTLVLADYQTLASWVKSHLSATLSLNVYLTCDDPYMVTSFDAENIRNNLKKSTSKNIEFRYNGAKLW